MLPVGIATLLIAMGVCWIATPFIIRLSRLLDVVDAPGVRKVHAQPIPRIGGLAVFLGFAAALLFAAWVTGRLDEVENADFYWRGLAAAAAFMLVVGLIDDVWGLSFHWKFLAQSVAAAYAWSCGFQVELIDLFGFGLELGPLSLPLTVLWIVGITNAVNLIDGLDGLATGIALITTTTVAVIAFVRGELGVTAASVALAGSLAGFLVYNFNPARIFLGDSGSMFLGFVLAVTSVRGAQKSSTAVAILVPLLVLGLPLLDTGVAIVRRLYRLRSEGAHTANSNVYVLRNLKRVFHADRGHIHHRLLDLGLSQRRAVTVLYTVGVAFAGVALAMVLLRSTWIGSILVIAMATLMAGFVGLLYLGGFWRARPRPAPAVAPRDEPAPPLPAARGQGR